MPRVSRYSVTVRLAAMAFILAACGGSSLTVETTAAAPTVTTHVVTTTTTTAPAPTTSTTEPLPEGWSLVARADAPVNVFSTPAAAEAFVTMEPTTYLGSPTTMLVLEPPVDGWLHVSVAVKPNGTTGWVKEDDVTVFLVDRRVEIDLSDRTLKVFRSNELELETTVAIGRPANPTPPGSYFITDSVILSNAGGPWGPHAFGLSAFSETITEFNGSDAVVGIHGTNSPNSIGSAASLGCIRVPNEIVLELSTMLSAGIPVVISD